MSKILLILIKRVNSLGFWFWLKINILQMTDSSGQVLEGTDFPRVFFLMHKWFMDSSTLIDVLFDLYNLYNQYEEQYEQETDKHYYENQQLKICFAFKWIERILFSKIWKIIILKNLKFLDKNVSVSFRGGHEFARVPKALLQHECKEA